jgi:hypothetical protein
MEKTARPSGRVGHPGRGAESPESRGSSCQRQACPHDPQPATPCAPAVAGLLPTRILNNPRVDSKVSHPPAPRHTPSAYGRNDALFPIDRMIVERKSKPEQLGHEAKERLIRRAYNRLGYG